MTFGGIAERIGRKIAMWNANRIRGVLVDDTGRADGRVLMYDAAGDGSLVYADPPAGGGGLPAIIDCGGPSDVAGLVIDCGGVV